MDITVMIKICPVHSLNIFAVQVDRIEHEINTGLKTFLIQKFPNITMLSELRWLFEIQT